MKINLRTLHGQEVQRILKESLDYNPETGEFRWKVSRGKAKKGDFAGTSDKDGYIKISIFQNTYRAHRLVWVIMTAQWPKHQIDHINQIKNDNRFANLREVDAAEQAKNQSINSKNKSGCAGVSLNKKNNRWVVCIKVDGKNKYLGSFVDKKDAIDARKDAEKEFGYHRNHGSLKKESLLKKKNIQGIRIEQGKWRVRIKRKGVMKHVGYFDTLEDAIAARTDAETNPQNIREKKPSKGYSWNKQNKKWAARITVNKKQIHLGYFLTEEEAIAARLAAEEKYKS